MKPINLTMQAFGSYGKMTYIDFTAVDQNLFLVTGDTGAGKTTIFDAIVFALYGETGSSANKKEGNILRSQYVGNDVTPYVTYTFVMSGLTYTVKRIPRHMRALKRASSKGNTETEEAGSVELTMPDGTVYPPKESDAKIKDIVGLTKEQFMQVAMIAQGEFMELLRTKSDNRKIIFRKLFNTGIYNDIVNELAECKKEYEKEIDVIKAKCLTYIDRVKLPDGYEKEEAYMQYHNQIKGGNLANLPEYLSELHNLCSDITEAKKEAENEYKKASEIRDKRMKNVTAAEALMTFYGQLEEAQEQLKDCADRKPEIARISKLKKEVSDAYNIKIIYSGMETAKNLIDSEEAELKKHRDVMPKTENELAEANKKYEDAKRLYEDEVEKLHKIQERVEKAVELFQKKEEAKEEYSEAKSKYDEIQEELENEKEKLADADAREQRYKREQEENEDAGLQFERWGNCNDEFEDILSEFKKVQKAVKDAGSIKEQYIEALKKYESAKIIYSEEKHSYDMEYQAFLDDQAGVLARNLVEGTPCPVCGSTVHPSPCAGSHGAKVKDRKELEELAEYIEELRSRSDQCSQEAGKLQTKCKVTAENVQKDYGKVIEKIEALIIRCGEYALFDTEKINTGLYLDITPDNIDIVDFGQASEKIEAIKDILRMAGKLIEERLKIYKSAKEQLKNIEDEKSTTVEKIKKLEAQCVDANVRAEAAKAVFENMETSTDYRSAGEAEKAKKEAKEGFKVIKDGYEQAENHRSELSKKQNEIVTLIKKLEKDMPVHKADYSKYNTEYKAALGNAGMGEDEWKGLAESYDVKNVDEWQQDINSYNERKAAATNQYNTAKEAIEGREKPDMEQLEKERDEAGEEARTLSEKYDAIKILDSNNNEIYRGMKKLMDERIETVGISARIERLYRTVSGNMSGARMDLETYVQRNYLEQILHAANIRFREMSSGQYEFRMYDINKAGEGKNRGLDLMIYSAVTGKEREIRTLSGGESFMAALSLALGIADRIQTGSASIDLEMMFIDEGFGMLDEYSRIQAVKVLKEMAGGNKMIGIISHVSELKQEIDNRLAVTKDDAGSSVRWVSG